MKKSEETRTEILKKSMEVIYKKGYHAASIDDMLQATQVTKGAFFYHFTSKEDMCLHMLKEVFANRTYDIWTRPLENSVDPIKDLLQLLRDILYDDERFDVKYGCPMINLIEEISPNHPVLRKELRAMTLEWMSGFEKLLLKGQQIGKVDSTVNCRETAAFIVAGYAGARNMGKIFGTSAYQTYLNQLELHLNASSSPSVN